MPDSPDEPGRSASHADLSGSAHDVVQAGNIHGGIHFHGDRESRRAVPRQLPGEALVSCQRSAVIQRRIGDRNREAAAHDGTGEAYRELGRLDEAAKFYRMAIVLYRELRDRWDNDAVASRCEAGVRSC